MFFTDVGHFFKKVFFIEFVIILLLFYALFFWLQGMWHLSSPTRDQTHTLCIGRQRLNHWIAGEVPHVFILICIRKNM